jgi:hypothetical protein
VHRQQPALEISPNGVPHPFYQLFDVQTAAQIDIKVK